MVRSEMSVLPHVMLIAANAFVMPSIVTAFPLTCSGKSLKGGKDKDLGWGISVGGDESSDTRRRNCQTFLLQPFLWRKNWFWIQVSDSTVYRSWQQKDEGKGPKVSDANPLWQLNKQFSIECRVSSGSTKTRAYRILISSAAVPRPLLPGDQAQ